MLRDHRTSALSDAERALFDFVVKINEDSCHIGPPDIDALHEAGWSDEAIYDALAVCALFNFYNRWIDASGVHALSDQMHKMSAERMRAGYIRNP